MPLSSALNPSDVRTLLSGRRKRPKSIKELESMALSSAMKAKMGARKSKTIKATMSLPKKAKKGGPGKMNLGRRV